MAPVAAYIAAAYIVVAYMVMAYIVVAYILILMAYIVMACIVMAYIVMAKESGGALLRRGGFARGVPADHGVPGLRVPDQDAAALQSLRPTRPGPVPRPSAPWIYFWRLFGACRRRTPRA